MLSTSFQSSAPTISENDLLALVKIIAANRGWRGNAGGWIVDAAGRPIVQGWSGLCAIAIARRWLAHVPTTMTWINSRRHVPGWKIDWRAVDRFRSQSTSRAEAVPQISG